MNSKLEINLTQNFELKTCNGLYLNNSTGAASYFFAVYSRSDMSSGELFMTKWVVGLCSELPIGFPFTEHLDKKI